MSISIRTSIRWLPGPATEPTSTVVLTSPERRFVDVRVLLPTETADALERLDWAIAGKSTSETLPDGRTHGTWSHWVDSRTRLVENVVDHGYMSEQPDGSTLETGNMINPDTGAAGDYEEVWKDIDMSGHDCVVLQAHDDALGVRGLAMRLGHFYQVVLRTGDDFSLARWQRQPADEGGEWLRSVAMGSRSASLPGPSSLPAESAVSQVGDSIFVQQEGPLQCQWTVVEYSSRV